MQFQSVVLPGSFMVRANSVADLLREPHGRVANEVIESPIQQKQTRDKDRDGQCLALHERDCNLKC